MRPSLRPGLGFDYLRALAEELAEENEVAWYQQRGLAPSVTLGPYTVATDVADASRRAASPPIHTQPWDPDRGVTNRALSRSEG